MTTETASRKLPAKNLLVKIILKSDYECHKAFNSEFINRI